MSSACGEPLWRIEDPRSDIDSDIDPEAVPPVVAAWSFLRDLQNASDDTGSSFVGQIPRLGEDRSPEGPQVEPVAPEVWQSLRVTEAVGDRPVDEAQLLQLVSVVKDAVGKVGPEPIMHIVEQLLADQEAEERLRDITSGPPAAPEVTARVISQVEQADRSEGAVRTLVIAGAVLLMAGAAIPVVAGVAAETILTNEIATAALVAAAAALLKK